MERSDRSWQEPMISTPSRGFRLVLTVLAGLLPVAALPATAEPLAANTAPQQRIQAQGRPRQPGRPAPRPKTYDPDTATCQPDVISRAYRDHLAPWADQPEPVQARLRLLQAEMTRTSLNRCIGKGLLTAEQAGALERQLGLPPLKPIQAQSQGTGTLP